MAFLLDTAALSELTRREPNQGFLRWVTSRSAEETFIGAPSIGELEIGVGLLDRSPKRSSLEKWLQKLIYDFGDRILAFDTKAARVWGRAVAHERKLGRTLPATDSQIAAIAIANGLSVVTRNVRHFSVDAFAELDVVNPWL